MKIKLQERGFMGKVAAMFMAATILISCNGPRPDPFCVDSSDFGADLRQTLTLEAALRDDPSHNVYDLTNNPDGKWIDTKLDVTQGNKLSITTRGEIFLCMDQPSSKLEETYTVTPNPTNSGWQDSGLTMKKGYKYTMEVSGRYNSFPSSTDYCPSKYRDADCWSSQGKGLFAYMGASATTNWFGTENQDDADNVFEMYRRNATASTIMPDNAGFGISSVQNDTKLWFRYRDAVFNDLNLNNSFTGGYNDNTGGYTITIKEYSFSQCKGTKGKFAQAKIVPGGNAATNSDNLPIIDIGACSVTGPDQTDSTSAYCNNGLYSTPNASATGRVWMKILDSDVAAADGSVGDKRYSEFLTTQTGNSTTTLVGLDLANCVSQYSGSVRAMACVKPDQTIVNDVTTTATCSTYGGTIVQKACVVTSYSVPTGTGSNTGEYSVNLVTPRPQGGGTMNSVINKVVEPVRTLLRGAKESMETSINACTAKGTVRSATCSGLNSSACISAGGYMAGALCTEARSCGTGTVEQVRCSLNTPQQGLTEKIYKNITFNSEFTQGVRAAIALAVVLFAFGYMAGLSTVTHKEFIQMMFKIAIVEVAIGPDSWEFFYKYLFTLFIEGSDNLIWIMSNNINSLISSSGDALMAGSGTTAAEQSRAIFGFLNTTMAIMFSQQTWIKIQAMLVSFPLGIFYIAVVIIGILYFLIAIMRAVLMYLTSIIMIGVLLFMGPIFISFILFKQTNSIFKKWIAQMAVYAFQPVMLFVVLSVFNIFILVSLYSVLDFSACYTCIWYLPALIPGTNFCVMPGYLPWGTDYSQNIYTQISKTPISLFGILIFVILTNEMLKFVGWVDAISTQLMGDDAAIMSTPGTVANAITDQAKGIVTDTKTNAWKVTKHADNLTGNKISDGSKMMARGAIKSIPLPSFMTNALVGRSKDLAIGGETRAFNTKFMTASEKRGYDKKAADFAKLSADQQQIVRDAHFKDRMEIKEARASSRGGVEENKKPGIMAYTKSNAFEAVGGNMYGNGVVRRERLSELKDIDAAFAKNNKEIEAAKKRKDTAPEEFNVYNVKNLVPGASLSEIYTPIKGQQVRSSSEIIGYKKKSDKTER